jgi:hypothetical protein
VSEIVFILGAGASRNAGAPLIADFLDKADRLRKSGKVNEFKPHFDRVFDAISQLQAIQAKAHLDLYNIESVFAAFEMGKLIGKLPGIKSEEIESLLESIRWLILKTLQETVKYPKRSGHIYPDDSYRRFAELVSELNSTGNQDKCSIITFNYDVALDYALRHGNQEVDYCFFKRKMPGQVSLMKLHGSVNWARCSKCRAVIPRDILTFVGECDFTGVGSGGPVRLPLVSQLWAAESKCGCGGDIEPIPVIVPPTWNKTQAQQGLSGVWARAGTELSDAENIFVSGYSLTETDLFFRYLFAIGAVGKSMIKRFWVFDPDEKGLVRDRFQKLVSQATLHSFDCKKSTFADAIDVIRKELKADLQI